MLNTQHNGGEIIELLEGGTIRWGLTSQGGGITSKVPLYPLNWKPWTQRRSYRGSVHLKLIGLNQNNFYF